MNSLLTNVKKILWQDWDPIGVNKSTEGEDEYDAYAQVIWVNYMQYSDFSEKYIYHYLMDIAQNYMGLSQVDSERTLIVAKKIFHLCENYPKSKLDEIEMEKIKSKLGKNVVDT
jgi:hypothetical protein